MDYSFSIGQAIDRGVRIWLRNFVPFTLLTALVYTPLLIWVYSITHGAVRVQELRTHLWISGGAVGQLNILLSAMLTYGVVMELRGTPATMVRCVTVGLWRFLPALGVSLLVLVAVLGGLVLLIIPGMVLTCMLYVAVPASIVEKPGVLGALRRSRLLTDGYKWHILGMTMLVGMIPSILLTVARFWMLGLDDRHASITQWTHYIYLQTAVSMVVGPLGAVFPAVTYYLLRQDKEGASVQELVRVFE